MTALYGITVWLLMAPVLLLALYAISRPLIEGMAAQLTRRHAAS